MTKIPGTRRMYRKGNYANTYTEVPAVHPGNAWREGMISGNGENGYITSGSPYSDSFIFQYMWFNFPSMDPRVIPKELTAQLPDARQNVLAQNDSWKITDETGGTRKRTFTTATIRDISSELTYLIKKVFPVMRDGRTMKRQRRECATVMRMGSGSAHPLPPGRIMFR